MKNITKNTKTFLFATLIVAIIIPFSTMDYTVVAEEENMSNSEKQKLIKQVKQLEERITQTTDQSLQDALKEEQQKILKKLFDAVSGSTTEFTVEEREGQTTTKSGGTITVDGIYTGCNDSSVNWNFSARTYSYTTWWNVSHWFPNAISVGESPNCTGANWDNNLYIESVEILTERGCHVNLTVGAISSYWLNCQHIMDGLVVSEIKADYEGYLEEITGYHYQFI